VFESSLFEFWECDPVFESVKEDKLGLVVLLLVVPDPPSSTGRIVGGCFGFMRRVPRLNDVLTGRRVIPLPYAPVLY